jgi:hypothetical protein
MVATDNGVVTWVLSPDYHSTTPLGLKPTTPLGLKRFPSSNSLGIF